MPSKITALRLNGTESIDPARPGGAVTRNLAIEQVEIREPGPMEVAVEPLFVGVCGSDNSASLGKPNFSWVERPRTIGHEFSGRIVGFGPGAEGWSGLAVGDQICAIPMRGCGDSRCRGCRRGRPNYCRRKKILGFHQDGALADRVVMEVDRCVPLRPDVSPLAGALIEPLSVVTQGIRRKCEIQPGMDVVVSGCGIMGLMAAELARAAGARVAVTGVEQDRSVRLQQADARGFTTIVVGPDAPLHAQLADGVTAHDGSRFGDAYENGCVDVLIECSGAPPALARAGLAVHAEGTICVIATYGSDVPFEATAFTRSGQSMRGVMGSSREDFEDAQTLLARGVFPVEEYAQRYEFGHVLEAMDDSLSARTPKAVLAIHGT